MFNLPFDRDVIDRWMAIDSELETSPPASEDEIIRELTASYSLKKLTIYPKSRPYNRKILLYEMPFRSGPAKN